jgi:transposase
MNIKEKERESTDWAYLVQDGQHWRNAVNSNGAWWVN